MMEAPSPVFTPKPIEPLNNIKNSGTKLESNTNDKNESLIGNTEFNLIYNKKNYLCIISMTSDKQYLNIQSKEENNFSYLFEIKMTLIELIKFDKIFKTCDDIEDAYNSMIVIFKNQKNYIKEVNDKQLIISINILNLDSSFREKDLKLSKISQNKDIIIEHLCKQLTDIKENNINLLNEFNKIKTENDTLKENLKSILSWKDEVTQNLKILMEKNELYEFKLFKIDSNIIKDQKDYDFIIERLRLNYSETPDINIGLYLIYRATRDGDAASDFHSKCDKSKNTLVIVKTKKGLRFGGFTSVTWEGKDEDKEDKKAFCFSLDKMKIYNCKKGKKAIFASPYSGPAFENCIFQIKDKCFEEGGECSDNINNNFQNQEVQYEINNGEELFEVADYEVFNVMIY